MSLDELIFSFLNQKLKGLKKDPFRNNTPCLLEDVKHRLEMLASMLHQKKIMIIGTDVHTLSLIDCIFLPTKLNFHENEIDNFHHYKYLILTHYEACERKLFIKENEDYFLKQNELSDGISKLILKKYSNFSQWPFGIGRFPAPILPENKTSIFQANEAKESELDIQRYDKKEEVQINTSGRPDYKELEQDEVNPVLHNFEKVKTLDDFSGGNRDTDGNDEDVSQEALDELKLDSVTRSNTPTNTVVKSDAILENATIVTLDENSDQNYFTYPEWFYKEARYRERWCRVKEVKMEHNNSLPFNFDIKLYKKCEHRFYYLFNENKKFKKQLEGPEIDLDEVIRYQVERKVYLQDYPRIFTKDYKKSLDVAFLFLIDTSLSTDSYIENRKVLDMAQNVGSILLKVFKTIEDRVACYSFYSNTRNRCVVEELKGFNDSTEYGLKSIASLIPKGYTRIGAALRHSREILSNCKAKEKFLIVISDAKPTDYDQYEGEHGIRDVRKAVQELSKDGINGHVFSFCKSNLRTITKIFDKQNFTYVFDEEKLLECFFYFLENQL
ncbi:MAG: VWA domain-containing protein [Halobacteriovoraceae bacterium]|nr:VWA domain-containing protein [Halobacteriovoraceae bacterium]